LVLPVVKKEEKEKKYGKRLKTYMYNNTLNTLNIKTTDNK
jgi:hypothetical protein|tara:strand:+ start:207 stop:326 length:120 start_codon:yes stop_codon:yes gene_type:complete